MKIRAAVLNGLDEAFRIETLQLAPPGPGEVLVRVEACGVCASDWNLVTGATKHALPLVPGHEGAGVIEAVGPEAGRLKAGDPVILNWAPGCGGCFQCLDARPALCEVNTRPIWKGTLLDGSCRLSRDGGEAVHHWCGLSCFAERAVVPAASCFVRPADVPPEVAALIGCAVTTGAGAALETAEVRPGESVLVYGAGGVGLSVVLGARVAGAAQVIVVERSEARAEAAVQLGASVGLIDDDDTVAEVRARTGGRGADVAIDATGAPGAQARCLDATRPGARIVFVGFPRQEATLALGTARLTREAKQIRGAYYGGGNPPREFARLVQLYRSGALPLDRLVGRRWALDEINEAFAELVAASSPLRGIVTFPGG